VSYIVYTFREPGKKDPFYVGKGKPARPRRHFELRHRLKSHFYNKLNSMLAKGIEPIVEVVGEGLTEGEAFDLEIKLIKHYGRLDIKTGCLCNHTDGGEGNSGGYSRLMMPHSIETRIKMSKPNKHKEKKIAAARVRAIPVESYNLVTGKTIKRYAAQADVKLDGHLQSSVSTVVNGRRRQHHGLGWRYTEC
jgi:hypothetical protein